MIFIKNSELSQDLIDDIIKYINEFGIPAIDIVGIMFCPEIKKASVRYCDDVAFSSVFSIRNVNFINRLSQIHRDNQINLII